MKQCYRRALVVILATLVVACTDPTGSETGTVAITATVAPFQIGTSDTLPTISCDVTFLTTVAGDTVGRTEWVDAVARFFVPADRKETTDTVFSSGADISRSWKDTLQGQQVSLWKFSDGAPFSATMEFRYHRGADAPHMYRVAATSFACSPPVPTSAPAPEVHIIGVTPVSEVEAGREVTVAYTASSSIGLWVSGVEISGPCVTQGGIFERMQTSTTHQVRIKVPPTCSFGSPLTFTARAIDFIQQSAASAPWVGPSVADRTPPKLSVYLNDNPDRYAGDLFEGDSLKMRFVASDNSTVSVIGWIIPYLDRRDSILVSTSDTVLDRRVLLGSNWVNADRILFYARDRAGLTSDTVSSPPGGLMVHPTAAYPVRTTSVPGQADVVQFDLLHGLLYILDRAALRITIVSTNGPQATGTIPVPSYVSDMDLTPGGDTLAVVLPYERRIGFIDLTTPARTQTFVPVSIGDSVPPELPVFMRITTNGRLFTTLQNGIAGWQLAEINLRTGVQRFRTDAGDGQVTGALLARSSDHGVMVLNGGSGSLLFQRYQSASDQFGPGRPYAGDPLPVLDATGSHTAIGFSVYDADLQFERRVRSVSAALGLISVPTAFSPDGQYLFNMVGKWVYRTRVSSGSIVDRFATPTPGWLWGIDGSIAVTTQVVNGTTNIGIVDMGP